MLQSLIHLAAQQQIAAGMVVAAVSSTLLFTLKSLPSRVWGACEALFTTRLFVEQTDEAFEHLALWLARSQTARTTRRLMPQREFDYDRDDFRWVLTLGRGWHIHWMGLVPVFIHREIRDGGEVAKLLGRGNQSLTLITLGRSQARLRRLVDEAEQAFKGDGKIRIYFWNDGYYLLADRRDPRPMSTVFLPAAQKQRLVEDVEAFVAAKAEYHRRGTPYRRSYLFTGPPGTGKTSLAFALASRLGRDVHVVNLQAVSSDNSLMVAFNAVGATGVLLIEDIDAAQITRDRATAALASAPTAAPGAPAPSERGITLSGLLNALDGVAAREGRVTFITTNHPEKLDPALLRPGRVDMREEIGPLERSAAWEMFKAFRPANWAWFVALTAGRLPMPAAELQNLLQAAEQPTDGPLVETEAAA